MNTREIENDGFSLSTLTLDGLVILYYKETKTLAIVDPRRQEREEIHLEIDNPNQIYAVKNNVILSSQYQTSVFDLKTKTLAFIQLDPEEYFVDYGVLNQNLWMTFSIERGRKGKEHIFTLFERRGEDIFIVAEMKKKLARSPSHEILITVDNIPYLIIERDSPDNFNYDIYDGLTLEYLSSYQSQHLVKISSNEDPIITFGRRKVVELKIARSSLKEVRHYEYKNLMINVISPSIIFVGDSIEDASYILNLNNMEEIEAPSGSSISKGNYTIVIPTYRDEDMLWIEDVSSDLLNYLPKLRLFQRR